ncbi:extracellular solute-binding protein [Photobacterium damselae]|uniref:extracellular solute-binding protein n=1 Tax=Photobacterium damselae TaxID=38293 RepID=UPI00083B0564|nr:extracellular solute-binding protein [Photobacterium damselae]ODA25068.1 diguanylate cyclase [Photobacterium damselae subsp. damselae]UKA10751.1 extracellular solute-binding protein [Photobacterium damselae subsp. damselae]
MMKPIVMTVAALGWLMIAPSWATTLPDDLKWQTNLDEPLFASPDAQFGGTFRTYIASFPQTFRVVGPDSNGSFRGWLVDYQPALVAKHPNTEAWLPNLATHWALADDHKTVYFRLNPAAKWSDGKPVTADDYLFMLQMMRSKDIVAPWYNEYYSKQIVDIVKFDDHTIAVKQAEPKNPDDLLYYSNLQPRPKHFYKVKTDKNSDGIDDNYVRRYNFKPEPVTGPYYLDKVKKGKSVTFRHVGQDWWGYQNPYYKHRYNVEKIRLTVIRDNDIARKHYEKGSLDAFNLVMPSLWHDKSNTEPYQKGYIEKFWGYNQTLQGAGGIWINTQKPLLNNIDVRKGLGYATDFDGMIEKVLRGDYVRQANGMGVGQGDYTNKDIQAPKFDLTKANEYFIKAGFDQFDAQGIRMNKKGERLSFAITYAYAEHTPRLAYLKEQAKQAGVEYILNLVDGSSAFKYVLENKHQLSFHTMGSSEIPAYWEYLHSSNANQPQTNNFTNYASSDMDSLIMAYRNEFDVSKKKALSKEIQQIVADEALIIPGYMVPYTRVGYWRWMKYPTPAMTKKTEQLFSVGMNSDLGTYWIDEKIKKETLAAIKQNKSFKPKVIVDESYK